MDRHGEDAANDLLKTVSWRITEQIRDSDTICHLKYNEFAILFPNTTEKNAIDAVEKIRMSIAAIPNPGEGAITLHVAVSEHQIGEDSMATFGEAYRRLELSRQDSRADRAALPQRGQALNPGP